MNKMNIRRSKALFIGAIIFLPLMVFAQSNFNNAQFSASITKIPLRVQQQMKQYTWRRGGNWKTLKDYMHFEK